MITRNPTDSAQVGIVSGQPELALYKLEMKKKEKQRIKLKKMQQLKEYNRLEKKDPPAKCYRRGKTNKGILT